jgi:hypothetical protein
VHPLKKALKASDRRLTRFHTERGELMPLSAWAQLPRSVAGRLRRAEQHEPWMVPAAVERLDELIRPTWQVLEFGSGASTVWYAERAAHVVSLEDDRAWLEAVRERLGACAPERCDLRLVELPDFPSVAAEFAPDTFDLVIIDSNEAAGMTRSDCAAAARPLVKPGGLVVIDDSDIREFQPMLKLFDGWYAERFVGVKSRPLMAVETTILRRPPAGGASAV